jgi:hypothetical protein
MRGYLEDIWDTLTIGTLSFDASVVFVSVWHEALAKAGASLTIFKRFGYDLCRRVSVQYAEHYR